MDTNESKRPQGTSERRWAVQVRGYYRGKLNDNSPFLAGRCYVYGEALSDETHPPTATYKTRAQARSRCARIRSSQPGWRVTARAVRVVVTTSLEAPLDGEASS